MLNVHSIVLVFQAACFPFHCCMFSPQGYEARPAPCLKTQLGGVRGQGQREGPLRGEREHGNYNSRWAPCLSTTGIAAEETET